MTGCVGITRSCGLGYEGFPGFPGLFDLVTGACLGRTVTLGADFAVLSCRFFPPRSFSNWAGSGVGNGWSSSPNNAASTDNVVPTGPRLSCSADGSASFTF
jgi:hypothetical protein